MATFGKNSALQAALQRGSAEGADLKWALRELQGYPVRSREDAEAICDALERFVEGRWPQRPGSESPLSALLGLFEWVDGECEAVAVLAERGLPLLIRIVDQAMLTLAEALFLELKQELGNDWPLWKEAGLLAEIWSRRGQAEQARAALREALWSLLTENQQATGLDRTFLEDCFQDHRRKFIELFPNGVANLAAENIPETTLRRPRVKWNQGADGQSLF
jgi:hypothetical protein